MTVRAHTSLSVNELSAFIKAESLSNSDIVFQNTNHSGGHDLVYHSNTSGSGSLKSGSTAAARAIYNATGILQPMSASQVAAAGGRTLTFDDGGGTITASSGNFLSDGYRPGMALTVAGSTSNNGTFYISTVTATIITIDSGADSDVYSVSITDEGPLSSSATLNASQAGWALHGATILHIVSYLPDTGTSIDFKLYLYDTASEQWTLFTGIGSSGTVSLAHSDANNPRRTVLSAEVSSGVLSGIEKVAIVTSNKSGVFSTGYSFWLVGAG